MFAIAILSFFVFCRFCSREIKNGGRLVVEPGFLDLGVVGPWRPIKRTIVLSNPCDREIVVSKVDVSCACVVVSPRVLRLPAGAVAELHVSFDPTEEPDFRGNLLLKIAGLDSVGQEVFLVQISLVVGSP